MGNVRRRAGVVAGILLTCCACALDPTLDVSQYAHTAWKIRDGFTAGAVNAIAQTPDGYLRQGTELGLVRFDGYGENGSLGIGVTDLYEESFSPLRTNPIFLITPRTQAFVRGPQLTSSRRLGMHSFWYTYDLKAWSAYSLAGSIRTSRATSRPACRTGRLLAATSAASA